MQTLSLKAASRWQIHTGILAGVLLIAALGVRLYDLNSGLWLDEILTYHNYARLPYSEIVTRFDSENQHFLYSLMAHTSFLLFGESNWALRLPAVLFGVASIGALLMFGTQAANRDEGLLAALLLTFLYHHVWFSQNARGYTGLLFWTLLSSSLLLKGIAGGGRRAWLYYGIAAALGMYTHLTMGFVVIGQLCVYLLELARARKESRTIPWAGLFLGFGAAGLLTLALYAPVIPQILNTIGGTEASVVTEWKSPLWTLLEILRGFEISFSGWLAAIAALFVFAAGLVSYWRSRREVVLLFAIPPAAGAAVTLAIGHHLWPRFFFFALGFGALILIRGLMETGRLAGKLLKFPAGRLDWPGIALCLAAIVVSAVSIRAAYGPKQDYLGAVRYLEAHIQPGEPVATAGLASFIYRDFYHLDWKDVTSQAELTALRAGGKRTWLVITFPPVLKAVYPDISAGVESDFTLQQEFPGTVANGSVYVFAAEKP